MNFRNGFPDDDDEEYYGSEYRYNERIKKFKRDKLKFPRLTHKLHWLLHNVIIHPLLGILPCKATIRFHDLSSKALNRYLTLHISINPNISNRKLWILHNVIAHIAIGLYPSTSTFKYHDDTARKMKVKGWV